MEIRTVALIGAGAIGGYFIWGLAGALGDDFCVVADGARKERLTRDGLVINGEKAVFPVKTPEEAKGADLVLVATKYAGLPSACGEVQKILTDQTIVISLLNGVDSEEILGDAIGKEHVVNAYMIISSEHRENAVTFNPAVTTGLFFGERDTKEKTKRCQALERLFARGQCRAQFVPDILSGQWQKFCRNICYNLPQAILSVGIGAYEDSAHVMAISEDLEKEVRTVAKACGCPIPPVRRSNMGYRKNARYSTLQDLDAKRPTEVDMFCGVLMMKAEEHGIEVPVTRTVYHLIKALEEKNEGKFEYTD